MNEWIEPPELEDPTDAAPDAILQVHRETEATVVTLVLRGELDITTLPLAEREVETAAAAGPAILLIDLSRLDFVDSSGVRLVLLADDTTRAAGRKLMVRLGTGPARRVFELLGLVDRLDIVDHEDPAGS